MKNKVAFQSIILSFVTMLALSLILPSFATKASASSIDLTDDNNLPSDETTPTDIELLKENLASNPNFASDLEEARNLFQLEVQNQYGDDIYTNGVVTAPLKALKALGATIKHGGTALSWILKPFSKKYSVLIKKHSRKISNVLAKPENGAKSYIQKQLISAGIPKSDAITIVHWIFIVL